MEAIQLDLFEFAAMQAANHPKVQDTRDEYLAVFAVTAVFIMPSSHF